MLNTYKSCQTINKHRVQEMRATQYYKLLTLKNKLAVLEHTPVEACVLTEARRDGQNSHRDSLGSLTPSSKQPYNTHMLIIY